MAQQKKKKTNEFVSPNGEKHVFTFMPAIRFRRYADHRDPKTRDDRPGRNGQRFTRYDTGLADDAKGSTVRGTPVAGFVTCARTRRIGFQRRYRHGQPEKNHTAASAFFRNYRTQTAVTTTDFYTLV